LRYKVAVEVEDERESQCGFSEGGKTDAKVFRILRKSAIEIPFSTMADLDEMKAAFARLEAQVAEERKTREVLEAKLAALSAPQPAAGVLPAKRKADDPESVEAPPAKKAKKAGLLSSDGRGFGFLNFPNMIGSSGEPDRGHEHLRSVFDGFDVVSAIAGPVFVRGCAEAKRPEHGVGGEALLQGGEEEEEEDEEKARKSSRLSAYLNAASNSGPSTQRFKEAGKAYLARHPVQAVLLCRNLLDSQAWARFTLTAKDELALNILVEGLLKGSSVSEVAVAKELDMEAAMSVRQLLAQMDNVAKLEEGMGSPRAASDEHLSDMVRRALDVKGVDLDLMEATLALKKVKAARKLLGKKSLDGTERGDADLQEEAEDQLVELRKALLAVSATKSVEERCASMLHAEERECMNFDCWSDEECVMLDSQQLFESRGEEGVWRRPRRERGQAAPPRQQARSQGCECEPPQTWQESGSARPQQEQKSTPSCPSGMVRLGCPARGGGAGEEEGSTRPVRAEQRLPLSDQHDVVMLDAESTVGPSSRASVDGRNAEWTTPACDVWTTGTVQASAPPSRAMPEQPSRKARRRQMTSVLPAPRPTSTDQVYPMRGVGAPAPAHVVGSRSALRKAFNKILKSLKRTAKRSRKLGKLLDSLLEMLKHQQRVSMLVVGLGENRAPSALDSSSVAKTVQAALVDAKEARVSGRGDGRDKEMDEVVKDSISTLSTEKNELQKKIVSLQAEMSAVRRKLQSATKKERVELVSAFDAPKKAFWNEELGQDYEFSKFQPLWDATDSGQGLIPRYVLFNADRFAKENVRTEAQMAEMLQRLGDELVETRKKEEGFVSLRPFGTFDPR
jgi:hypothetical protein